MRVLSACVHDMCTHMFAASSLPFATHLQSRAIDRLLEFGANTKVKACEKRFAGHSLVLNNCSLLLAKIKQRQEQR